LITTSIRVSRTSIVCDFHNRGHSFPDFFQFFEYVLKQARKRGVRKVKLVHGRGKDENGLELLPEIMLERLSSQEEIETIEPARSRGEVTIYLRTKSFSKKENPMKSELKSLLKELQSQEKTEILEKKKEQKRELKQSSSKDEIYAVLDENWDEDKVKETVDSWLERRQFAKVEALLQYIQDFEVFFSPEFTKYYRESMNRLMAQGYAY